MSKQWLWSALFFCGVNTLVFATGQDEGVDARSPLISDVERSRIQAERTRAEADYQRQEAACFEQFAVTDCIRQVKRTRREVFDRLRQQEVVINARERKRKALDQLERIKEKSSDQQLAEDAVKRVEAQSIQQEREQNSSQKANASSSLKQAPSVPHQAAAQGLTTGEITKNRQQYNDKLKEAEVNRLNRWKSNSEKTGTPKKPLTEYP